LSPLNKPYTNNKPLKTLTTIILVTGIISYATGTVTLASAFELSTPSKNLQVQWWKWILGIPPEDSPVLDVTGENCAEDQKGPIWYLAGFAGSSEGPPFGGSAERDCTIPEGKDLLIPIFNTVCAEITDAGLIKQELGLGEDEEILPSQLHEGLIRCTDFIMSFVKEKQFSIDGEALTEEDFANLRVVSSQFQIVYPEGNVFNQAPTNVKQKAVAQGFWILVEDLEPGEHTIEVVSGLPDFDFRTSVTYHLTIESKSTSPLLQEETDPVLSKLTGKPEESQPSEGISIMNKLLAK
jgi:hypothetical protein